ncbi:MAG TPA: Xaa-Pro peptidase family protein [Steroidobacteraceae bacterium]|nr:Xaa-Pro peptidase family protein [Steroidobacteraceae bacterium]
MSTVTRRAFIGAAAGGAALGACDVLAKGKSQPALHSLTASARPIDAAEHAQRLEKLQSLMQAQHTAALLVEAGSSLEYFTGVDWWRSERTTAALIPARGRTVIVTPYFEEPSIRETLKVEADVRAWKEDESPFERLAAILQDTPEGALAIEPTTRFFIIDRIRQAATRSREVRSGDELVRACRLIKSPAELALLQAANNVTMAAIRHVHGQLHAGLTNNEILKLVIAATEQLGGKHETTLVLLNEASAFPHGSATPQTLREGSVVLIDTGCSVHGYASDISRSWVFGSASARQRELWNTVKRGQEIALETARPGVPCGAVDRAVRSYYEGLGWSRDYALPGLSHRTGHGIGLDGHEAPYLVRSDTTPLQPGMCFSDEPGLYVPGEFGIRLEDCWYMGESAPQLFTPLARSLEQPV